MSEEVSKAAHTVFQLLNAARFEEVASLLNEDVVFSDELTGGWLIGRDAVAGWLYDLAGGPVTDVNCTFEELSSRWLVPGSLGLVVYEAVQEYRVWNKPRSERLVGLLLLQWKGKDWEIVAYQLAPWRRAEPARLHL